MAPERFDKLPYGLSVKERIGVGQNHDLASGSCHEVIHHTGLSSPLLKRHETNSLILKALEDLTGPVRRAVGTDQNLKTFSRIIKIQQVLDALDNDVLFIVRRQENADSRPLGRCRALMLLRTREPAQDPEDGRISCICVEQEPDRTKCQKD